MLIDGNSVLNRAFYGIRPLTTSTGLHTNAVYGFLTILLRHISEDSPDAIYAAFDVKYPTFRHELYKDYKAGRRPTPEELLQQFPVIKRVLAAAGVICLEQPGMEADDIIGVLSAKFSDRGDDCVIITGDRDELQLVSDKVTVKLAVTKASSGDDIYTPETIKEKYGLTPAQLIQLKALMGDSSDNIPGVAGVGEKTALDLLHSYPTLEDVYANTDNIKGKLREKLEAGKDSAFMSRTLGTIMRRPLPGVCFPEPEDCPQRDNKALHDIFTELEMPSMFSRFGLDKAAPEKPSETVSPGRPAEQYDPARHTLPEGEVFLLRTDDGFIMDFGGTAVRTDDETALKLISGRNIVTHDVKPLLKQLMTRNTEAFPCFDTMLAGYVLNPSKPSYPLRNLYIENLSRDIPDASEQLLGLNALRKKMTESMAENGSADLYRDIDLPLSSVLAQMEAVGVRADEDFLRRFGKTLDEDIQTVTDAVYQQAGHELNINSPKQLGTLLFEELSLPHGKKTKIGYATDNDTLESLADLHPIIDNIISYRKLTKLKSTYVDGLLRAISDDGRIHTVFTQTVTQTGRISSIEPNLQNIPVRTALGRELRRCFVAQEGCVLLDADYSQIELRIMAHISGDENMQQIFRENTDIHTRTAAQVFGLPEQFVTPELRRRAKAINFGIIYGIGDYSLSRDIGVTRKEARKYIDNYLSAFPKVKQYISDVVQQGREKGYVTTLFGRRRYVPELKATNKVTQAFGQRVCMNTPIQGTAADLIKLSMIKVSQRLRQEGLRSRLILQIHDELIIEAPENEADKAAEILKHEMENAYRFDIPLVAEVSRGKTWYEAKD